jgi:hypothetical protein
MRLGGAEIALTSPDALARWRAIYLIEDNSARAARQQVNGLVRNRGRATVVLRVHRITPAGIWTLAEARYAPGDLAQPPGQPGRSALALGLLDGLRPNRRAVIVAGPDYGAVRGFIEGLEQRGLDAVVGIKPSTRVVLADSRSDAPTPVRDLLQGAAWTHHQAHFTGSAEPVDYALAVLGQACIGLRGAVVFAGQKGGINGVHPGTIFGLAAGRSATPDELLGRVSAPTADKHMREKRRIYVRVPTASRYSCSKRAVSAVPRFH